MGAMDTSACVHLFLRYSGICIKWFYIDVNGNSAVYSYQNSSQTIEQTSLTFLKLLREERSSLYVHGHHGRLINEPNHGCNSHTTSMFTYVLCHSGVYIRRFSNDVNGNSAVYSYHNCSQATEPTSLTFLKLVWENRSLSLGTMNDQ